MFSKEIQPPCDSSIVLLGSWLRRIPLEAGLEFKIHVPRTAIGPPMNTVAKKISCRPDLTAAAGRQPSPLMTRTAYSPAEWDEGWLSREKMGHSIIDSPQFSCDGPFKIMIYRSKAQM
jgi:hypothetical protein